MISESTKATEPDPRDATSLQEFSNYGVASRMATDMYQSLRSAGLDPQEATEQVHGAFFTFSEEGE